MQKDLSRLPALDGLRGLAFLLVLVWHFVPGQLTGDFPSASWQSISLKYLAKTWSGVDLFFVLSGFLIFRLLFHHGFFQSEKFFLSIQETVRQHFSFRFPPTSEVSRWAELISSSTPSICLHVRRGDYLSLYQDKFGVLGRDYYRNAIQAIKERHSGLTIFVFSDDIDAAEKELELDLPHHFVRATEHHNFYDKIRLMSLCDHAIISNGTFAWLGAWLIPGKEKTVVAPKPWFTGEGLDQLQIVSESWVQIPRAARDSFITPSIS